MHNKYRPGDHYIICDASGRKILRSDAVIQWDGAMVDKRLVDERHPQDFVHGTKDKIAVDDGRSEPDDNFLVTPIQASDL